MPAEIVVSEDVLVPVLVTVIAALTLACVLWITRVMSKVATHVLPHFDPAKVQEKDGLTLPQRVREVEIASRQQSDDLARHLDEEERLNGGTAQALEGLRQDIRDVHGRIDAVLGPGNPEVRRTTHLDPEGES